MHFGSIKESTLRISDIYFTVPGLSPSSTLALLRSGQRFDSFSKNLPEDSFPHLPSRFKRFAAIGLDENARAILASIDSIQVPYGDNIGVFVTVGNAQKANCGSRYASYDMLPGIVSYVLNTTGPAIYMASTCDSFGSMLTTAVAMMQSGLIDGAILAASNLLVGDINPSSSPIMSSAGVCRPFSANRDGSYPGRGYGALSLSKDEKYQVFIDSALTRSSGSARPSFTAPSLSAQYLTIKEAWELSSFSLKNALFVETHGTGTVIGDTLEAEALRRVISESGRTASLVLGTSKGNLGHLDSCSGLAALAHAVDCLSGERYPLTVREPGYNPDNQVLGSMLRLGSGGSLPRSGGGVGVTMNGISGSTTHVVIGKD